MKMWQLCLAVILCCGLSFGVSMIGCVPEPVQLANNSKGNLMNTADIFEYNGWIYYNPEANVNPIYKKKEGFYKVRSDGTQITFISSYFFCRINVEDNCMYMVNKQPLPLGDPGLYKMELEGINKDKPVKICDCDNRDKDGNITHYYCDWMYVIDGWIYFDYEHDLYKMQTDGSDRTLIYDGEGYVFYIYPVGDWIYFLDANKYYKIQKDGSDLTLIYDWGEIIGNGEMFQVVDDWVYYVREPEDQIYKMRTDGSDITKVSDHQVDFSYINVQEDGFIYYKPGLSAVWKIDYDGQIDSFIGYDLDLAILNGWVYGMHIGDLNRARTDGTGFERFVDYRDLPVP